MIGAGASRNIVGQQLLPGKSNYLLGRDPSRWITNVPQYARVEYREIYPGIDLVYHGDQESAGFGGRLEYDFVVAPGADPNRILLAFEGAGTSSPRFDSASGDLLLTAGKAQIRQLRPRIFQDIRGTRHEIGGRYVAAQPSRH